MRAAMDHRQLNGSSKQKLFRIQKEIYDSLKDELDEVLGALPKSIRDYEKRYRRDFKSRPVSIAKKELIRAVRNTDVTFIADFHTFDQAQRTALRILKDAYRPGEKWLVGLELISSQYQKALDRFIDGKISLEKLYHEIHYEEDWGFPWKNYAPIFIWARENKVGLVALNRPRQLLYTRNFVEARTAKDLQKRDEWATGIITDLFYAKTQKQRMVVLYGDLHVASEHLPFQLKKISKVFLGTALHSVSIHQNVDQIYWAAARKKSDQIFRLKPEVYCILSGTPWGKIQSLIQWIEHSTRVEEDESEDFEVDPDYLGHMRDYGRTISRFFGIAPHDFESETVVTGNDLDLRFLRRHLTMSEIRFVQILVREKQKFYLPKVHTAFLGDHSHNAVAEMAAILIFHWFHPRESLLIEDTGDFITETLQQAFGFLGSLILNPRRKCDLEIDHIERVESLQRNRAKTKFFKELEIRRAVLRVLQCRNERELERAIWNRSPWEKKMTARLFGQILGTGVYQALLSEQVAMAEVKNLFLKRSFSSSGGKRHHSLLFRALDLGLIAAAGVSKKERI